MDAIKETLKFTPYCLAALLDIGPQTIPLCTKNRRNGRNRRRKHSKEKEEGQEHYSKEEKSKTC